jgi:Rha family phage regulatory protein
VDASSQARKTLEESCEGGIALNKLNVIERDGQLLVDSREVAEMVGKEHKNLLRDIKSYVSILTGSTLSPLNFFVESSYKDSKGEVRACFLLTRKGCDMVANKMIGEKGVLFTATYVTRFEEMEKALMKLNTPSYMLEDPIERARQWIKEQSEKRMLEQRVAEYEPKVTYYDIILKSKDTLNITQVAKDYGLSGKALNKILHEEKVQYKLSGQWLLYSKYHDKGYTKSDTTEYRKSNGETGVTLHTKWTQKGRLFIHQLLVARGIHPVMDRQSEAS